MGGKAGKGKGKGGRDGRGGEKGGKRRGKGGKGKGRTPTAFWTNRTLLRGNVR